MSWNTDYRVHTSNRLQWKHSLQRIRLCRLLLVLSMQCNDNNDMLRGISDTSAPRSVGFSRTASLVDRAYTASVVGPH